MVTVVLDRGKFKILPEKGLKMLKKKLQKENTLRDLRDRQYYVSKGRKAHIARSHREHALEQERAANNSGYKR